MSMSRSGGCFSVHGSGCSLWPTEDDFDEEMDEDVFSRKQVMVPKIDGV